jgi:hypothetical protein
MGQYLSINQYFRNPQPLIFIPVLVDEEARLVSIPVAQGYLLAVIKIRDININSVLNLAIATLSLEVIHAVVFHSR